MAKPVMARVVSAIRGPFQVRLPAAVPIVVGGMENRPVSPRLQLLPFKPVEVTEQAAVVITTRYGRRGIVEMADDETLEQASMRARELRLRFLRAYLNGFRAVNADLRARGLSILMPTERHRDALLEMKQLEQAIGGYEELTGPPTGPVEDVAARELAEFGIPPGAASLTPGVEDNFTRISNSGTPDL